MDKIFKHYWVEFVVAILVIAYGVYMLTQGEPIAAVIGVVVGIISQRVINYGIPGVQKSEGMFSVQEFREHH